jgi:hypothetical protein
MLSSVHTGVYTVVLPVTNISSIDELCGKSESDGSSEKEEEGLECEPEPVLSFIEAHAAYSTPKSFSYVHSIGEHDKHNILNMKLALFHLKHKVSSKQLSVIYFL